LARTGMVHIRVDEAAHPPIVGDTVALERLVASRQPLEQLADVGCLELHRVTPIDVRAQRGRDQDGHCHTTFRSSMVTGSSANPERSSDRTQLFRSPAPPRATATITYESHGHPFSRSKADGAGG